MTTLLIAAGLTVGVSAFCSLLEAILLSVTALDIESLKSKHYRRGELMEQFREQIEESSSAVLALNTVANTLGAVVVGGVATELFGDENLLYVSVIMTLSILLFAEILPKNIGVAYRSQLLAHSVYMLYAVRTLMRPISGACRRIVRFLVRDPKGKSSDQGADEIILLANKGAREGELSPDERTMITNALHLEEVLVGDLMTPRTVVVGIDKDKPLNEVFAELPDLPFARIPVFEDDLSNVVGFVRRRDLWRYKANGEDLSIKAESLMHKAVFVPESARASDALQQCIKAHQQLAIVVDEFGSMAGVITLEDVFEYLIGKEIFEADDVAIDMRELARKKKHRRS